MQEKSADDDDKEVVRQEGKVNDLMLHFLHSTVEARLPWKVKFRLGKALWRLVRSESCLNLDISRLFSSVATVSFPAGVSSLLHIHCVSLER